MAFLFSHFDFKKNNLIGVNQEKKIKIVLIDDEKRTSDKKVEEKKIEDKKKEATVQEKE